MKTNAKTQKDVASELLKRLDIFEPYVKGFKENNQVCLFEGCAGFWIDQEPELCKKMKELESKYGCTVYAVTHDFTVHGELYSFLIVTKYRGEWKKLVKSHGNEHRALAYVYKLYIGVQIFKYLRLYEQFPQIEYLMKTGLTNIAMSKVILRKCGKDKTFCKWLIAHKSEIIAHNYYITTITKAYSTGKSLKSTQETERLKKEFYTDSAFRELREPFKDDALKLISYLEDQMTATSCYNDYYKACIYLGIDMTLPKNRYPHDFRRWHDIRIDEYRTAIALKNKKAREQLYLSFAMVAEKYAVLQHDKRSAFICVIAKSPDDLITEGEVLHHCVGSMNYDQRFIKEQSLIFFIRTREQPDTPYVTVEYSLSAHKVLQCYGDRDSKPSDEVLHYVNKVWLPYANKNIKQRAAAPIT